MKLDSNVFATEIAGDLHSISKARAYQAATIDNRSKANPL